MTLTRAKRRLLAACYVADDAQGRLCPEFRAAIEALPDHTLLLGLAPEMRRPVEDMLDQVDGCERKERST